jgi:FMN phosphatase YigB (HAD superfamily)
MKQRVSVVITDLDNTLFDWVSFWYHSFKGFYDFLLAESGLPETVLAQEMRRLFQQQRTCEYLLAYSEICAFPGFSQNGDFAQKYAAALLQYRQRRQTIRPYPAVRETLVALKATGCRVVIFTESQKRYTCTRLQRLGLLPLVDAVFSPADRGGALPTAQAAPPTRLTPGACRYYPLRPDQAKPDPHTLLEILQVINASAQECIYIGDHLLKDIQMAQAAGVTDVHARYGQAQFSAAYQLLRTVSFWTDEEIAQEQAFYARARAVTPSYTLAASFHEVLDLFAFGGG